MVFSTLISLECLIRMNLNERSRGAAMADKQQYDLGMVGLGVMGRNLLLNMADHGFALAGYDLDRSKVEALRQEAGKRTIVAVDTAEALVQSLKTPGQ